MRRTLVALLLLVLLAAIVPFVGDTLFGWGPDASLLPVRGQLVDIGSSRRLNVFDQGEGRPIVLVHGSPSHAAEWSALPARLAALGHRVVTYDRPGYGHSTRLAGPHGRYTYVSNAMDLLALLDALGLEQVSLVGWSFGGGVVQELAVRRPDRVSHVVLIGSVGPDMPRDPSPRLVDRIIASPFGVGILTWISKVPPLSYRLVHDSLILAFSGSRAIPTGWTLHTQAALSMPGTFATLVGETRFADHTQLRPEDIGVPSLVIHGSEDFLVPYSVGLDLDARLPTSALESVIGGSHMLPVTHPDLLAARIHELVGSRYREGSLPEEPPGDEAP